MSELSCFGYSVRKFPRGEEVFKFEYSSLHIEGEVREKGGKEVLDEMNKQNIHLEDGTYEVIAIRYSKDGIAIREIPIIEFEIKDGSFYLKWSNKPQP